MRWIFGKGRKKKKREGRLLAVDDIKEECRRIFGDNLVSIVAYGPRLATESPSGGDSASFIVVFRKLDLETIAKAKALLSEVPGEHDLSPLIVEEGELFDVASSFPIEFLAARSNYRILLGKDVLKDLIVSAEYLPLKAKLEIMRLCVLGRRHLIFSIEDPQALATLLARDFPRCLNAIRALLVAKRRHAPADTSEIIERAAEDFSIDAAVLERLEGIKEGSVPEEPSEIPALFFQYLRELYFAYKAADELSMKMTEGQGPPAPDDREFIE
jgi:hypothetical protein